MPAAHPNLVFVVADQLRLASTGYAGDPLARTPNLDRLSHECIDFHNAVSSMPVCSAFRASLMTGLYTTSNGMVINELRLNPNQRCLGHCLHDGGYATSYIGKWHLYANQLGHHDDPKNSYIPSGDYRLGFDDYFVGYNFRHDYFAPKAYYHTDSPAKIPYPNGVYEPDFQTDMAIRRLAYHVERQRSDDARPFALFMNVGTPHDAWARDNVPAEWLRPFVGVDFPLSPTYRDEPDRPYGDAWSDEPKDAERVREWMRVYYAMVANLDWNVGRLAAAIDRMGLRDDTVFVFTSDHGECFGAHGRMKKNIFYDEAARVPCLVRWPAAQRAAVRAGAAEYARRSAVCWSSVGWLPTLCGLLGVEPPAQAQGTDLSWVVRGGRGVAPAAAFLQNTGACALWEDGHEWRAVRDERYTYAVYKVDGKELLFDNEEDPYQANNVIDDAGYAWTLERLRGIMRDKMAEIGDEFNVSSYYRDHWIDADRKIVRTATEDWTRG